MPLLAGLVDARVEVETVGRASEQAASTNASGIFYHVWMQACVTECRQHPCGAIAFNKELVAAVCCCMDCLWCWLMMHTPLTDARNARLDSQLWLQGPILYASDTEEHVIRSNHSGEPDVQALM